MKDLICDCGEPGTACSVDYPEGVCDTCYFIRDTLWDMRILSSLPVDAIDRKYGLSFGRHRREDSLTG